MHCWSSTAVADLGRLAVLVGDRLAGSLSRRSNNLLRFEYDPAYRTGAVATPLSLSMPVVAMTHADSPANRTVTNFLAGLLPDDPDTVAVWASHWGVRTSSPFFLLSTPVGRDCAGGVAFCPDDELDDYLARGGEVEWLTETEVAEILRDVRRNPALALGRSFSGQFSLSGAQGKTALRRSSDGRWGRPTGTEPTTHILKPASTGWTDQDVNEHLCLAAAARCGLDVARSELLHFGDQEAIAIARYDRIAMSDGRVVRVHQEDLCQALGLSPDEKYERDGGPGTKRIAALLRRVMPPLEAEEAVRAFGNALAFNWVVMGTDAHAKNYSVLLRGRAVRLAPLYDLTSMLPYVGSRSPASREVISERRQTFAMRLGSDRDVYPLRNVWSQVARDLRLPADRLAARVASIAAAVPDAFADAAAAPVIARLESDIARRLVDRVAERASACIAVLGG